jgi:putative protease
VPLNVEVARDEPVFKTYDSELMASLELPDPVKIPVKMHLKAIIGEPLELLVSDLANEISVKGNIVSKAESKPISRNSIAEQLRKLGATIFKPAEISFDLDENIFIPISELNSIRKEGINLLEQTRVQKWKRQCNKPVAASKKKKLEILPILSVNTGSIECFEAAVDSGADVVYFGGENFQSKEPEYEDYLHAIEYGRERDVKVCLNTHRIIRKLDEISDLIATNPDGFLVSNLGVLYHLLNSNNIAPVVLDYPLNVFNRLTLGHLMDCSNRVTLSPELTLEEIRNITPFGITECIVHGLFPLMVSEHGLVKGLFPPGRTGDVLLRDEKGFSFPVKTDQHGRTYVMNSRELCMLEYVPELLKAGVNCLRLEAKTYDEMKTKRITRSYRRAMDDSMIGIKMENRCRDLGEFTTGHYFRGVL